MSSMSAGEGCAAAIGGIIGTLLSVMFCAWIVQIMVGYVFNYHLSFWVITLCLYVVRIVIRTVK